VRPSSPSTQIRLTSITDDREVQTNDVTFPDFSGYIHTLNAALAPFSYEIRSAHPQSSTAARSPESAIYALVNTVSDPQTQLATARSPDEIAFVKRVLDAMFDTNNTADRELCAVKVKDAVRLAKAPPRPVADGPREAQTPGGGDDEAEGTPARTQRRRQQGPAASSITLDRAERILDELVTERWLEREGGRDGWLALAPRALLELGGWLDETYNASPDDENDDSSTVETWPRIKKCEGCKQIVTVVSFSFRSLPWWQWRGLTNGCRGNGATRGCAFAGGTTTACRPSSAGRRYAGARTARSSGAGRASSERGRGTGHGGPTADAVMQSLAISQTLVRT
jgi:hypothetical protein